MLLFEKIASNLKLGIDILSVPFFFKLEYLRKEPKMTKYEIAAELEEAHEAILEFIHRLDFIEMDESITEMSKLDQEILHYAKIEGSNLDRLLCVLAKDFSGSKNPDA